MVNGISPMTLLLTSSLCLNSLLPLSLSSKFCKSFAADYTFISGQNVESYFKKELALQFYCRNTDYGFLNVSLNWNPGIGNQIQEAEADFSGTAGEEIFPVNMIVLDQHSPEFRISKSKTSTEMIDELVVCGDYIDYSGTVY